MLNYCRMLIFPTTLLSLSFFLSACGGSFNPHEISSFADKANQGLDKVLNETAQKDNVVNTVLLVEAPSRNYRYLKAAGLANPATEETMTGRHAFRIASISKTFVATVVLQLIEEGYFSLDTPLEALLDDSDLPEGYSLDDIHRYKGRSYGKTITPRHLLQHTSGVRDFMQEGATEGLPLAERGLVYRSLSDYLNGGAKGLVHKQWSRDLLLKYYLERGYGDNALFKPGSSYHYSDSGYLMLGVIIEETTGLSLTANLRHRLFTPLALTSTYHEYYEAAIGAPKAHHFFDLSLLGQTGNIDIDASGGNTSASWAGGGIVSTPEDLLAFFKALLRGDLFQNETTLKNMQTLSAASPNYGLGLQAGAVDGYLVWGHTGYWGAAVACSDEKNTCLALAVNQVNSNVFDLGAKAFKVLLDAGL